MKNIKIYFFIFLILTVVLLFINPIIGIVCALLFGLWCLKNFINPLQKINDKIKNFSIFKKSSADEITLWETEREIDKLLFEYENLLKALEKKEEKFKFFLESLPNAILLVDDNGKIKYYNGKFFDLFSKMGVLIQTAEKIGDGKFYWEIIRDFNLIEFIKYAVGYRGKWDNLKLSREIEIYGKTFNVSAFKGNDEEVFIIFDDISLAKELVEIKRELVENISHELKTPLSNIKGYIETLEEELKRIGKKFKQINEIIIYLDPVKRNTDRLIRIINDLLILSEVEYGVKFEEEKIDFKKILNGILKMYEKTLKDKKLSCELNISDELPEFYADPYRIEQMLFNLVDNAVKYTDKGGIKIRIEPYKEHSERKPNAIRIIVEDTGIGIPREHIPRIFERFYVVDKSRSRQSGGTGLGLSIVKHIVLMYNGKINVESKVGIGTRFEIVLPVKKQDKIKPKEIKI